MFLFLNCFWRFLFLDLYIPELSFIVIDGDVTVGFSTDIEVVSNLYTVNVCTKTPFDRGTWLQVALHDKYELTVLKRLVISLTNFFDAINLRKQIFTYIDISAKSTQK